MRLNGADNVGVWDEDVMQVGGACSGEMFRNMRQASSVLIFIGGLR